MASALYQFDHVAGKWADVSQVRREIETLLNAALRDPCANRQARETAPV